VAEVAVVNASPLIFLARGRHLDLLSAFFQRVLVPIQVADEILARGPEDITAKAMHQAAWLEVCPVQQIPAMIGSWGLGPGESAVIALAQSMPGCEVIIDDLAGRRCSAALGIAVRGTVGLILLAKKRGIIPLARPVLEDLLRGGMYLSRHVIDDALARVGE
jgi:predicted nucleic acid-binding protein